MQDWQVSIVRSLAIAPLVGLIFLVYVFGVDEKRPPLVRSTSKEKLRETLRQRRKLRIARQQRAGLPGLRHRLRAALQRRRIEGRIWRHLASRPPGRIGAYIPLPGEIDLSRLMTRLHRRGWIIGLPCIEDASSFLRFRVWSPGDALVQGRYDIWQPDRDQPDFLPGVVLVPLLGYDRFGQRLGMGAGWYDRTFMSWKYFDGKPVPPPLKIGIAYADQAVDHIPAEEHDQPLDMIATPEGWLDCRAFTRI